MTHAKALRAFLVTTALDPALRERFRDDPGAVCAEFGVTEGDRVALAAGGEAALALLGRALTEEVGEDWQGETAQKPGAGPVMLDLPEVRYELLVRPHAVLQPNGQVHLSFSTSVRPLMATAPVASVDTGAVEEAAAAVLGSRTDERKDKLFALFDALEGR